MEPHLHADVTSFQKEVTGSCKSIVCKFPTTYGEYRTVHFLVDCGMYQEPDYLEDNEYLPVNPRKLDFVLVTHNHMDHIGRIPLLVKRGFGGRIFVNKVQKKMIATAYKDQLKIFENDFEATGKKPLYTEEDVNQTISQLIEVDFDTVYEVYNPGTGDKISIIFFQNGHMVSASMIYVRIHPAVFPKWMTSNKDMNFLFSGDYNKENTFTDIPRLTNLFLNKRLIIDQESTYGYMDSSEVKKSFENNVLDAISSGKLIINCSIAQERSLQVLYAIRTLQDEGKIPPEIPIYLDGKLAYKYADKYMDLFKKGCGKISFKVNPEKIIPLSCKRIYKEKDRENVISMAGIKPGIVITTSGDGSHGPAIEYISSLIENPDVVFQFTGYTTKGSLGSKLKKSKFGSTVTINGKQLVRRAKICSTNEFSEHAKADELLDFLRQFKNIAYVMVSHGNSGVKEQYVEKVKKELNLQNKIDALYPSTVYRFYCKGLEKTFSG